ncbi:MAG: putative sugar nucleotidyl transferase, partial [Thermofilaceae archaeon]
MRVAVFEDSAALNLIPLTYTKAIYDLLVGCRTLLERASLEFGRVDYVFVRSYLAGFYAKERGLPTNPRETDDDLLLINPRYIVNQPVVGLLKAKVKEGRPFMLLHGDDVVGALLPERSAMELLNSYSYSEELEHFLKNLELKFYTLSLESGEGVENLWDLIEWNEKLLSADLLDRCGRLEGDISDKAVILGDKISIMEGAEIGPYAVIDCRKGPVFIDKRAVVNSFSYIEGPSHIGKDTVVMPGAKLRGGIVIGPVCRVGGEIEAAVFHG